MNKNKFFSPPEYLLQSIDFLFKQPLILIIPTANENIKRDCEINVSYVAALKGMFSEYYRGKFTPENSQYLLVDMFSEPLRNAMEHGNRFDYNTNTIVGVWVGNKGVLFAFRDQGDFFSKESTKKDYESRKEIVSTRVNSPSGFGTISLFETAEVIYVATEENTLYATYLLRP